MKYTLFLNIYEVLYVPLFATEVLYISPQLHVDLSAHKIMQKPACCFHELFGRCDCV